jgi:quinol monooxygenase YgiN
MVVEYIRYTIPPERSDEFHAAYARAQEALAGSAHCLRWELSRGVEEPEHFMLRIEWDSLEGHERGFRTSPEFGSFFAAVRPFVANIEEMKHYEVTDIAGARP